MSARSSWNREERAVIDRPYSTYIDSVPDYVRIDNYIPVSTLRNIEEQHGNVVITKNGLPKAVLLRYEDFESLLETIDILSDA